MGRNQQIEENKEAIRTFIQKAKLAGLSQQDMVEALSSMGISIDQSTVSKISQQIETDMLVNTLQAPTTLNYLTDTDVYNGVKNFILELLKKENIEKLVNRYNIASVLTALLDFWAKMASIQQGGNPSVNMAGGVVKIEFVSNNKEKDDNSSTK